MSDKAGERNIEPRKRDLETLEALYEHWARGDFDYTEAFADDWVWAPADALETGEYTGSEQIRESWRGWLQSWDGFQVEATEVIPGPEGRYLVMQVFRGKGKASGVESTGQTAVVAAMRDGKIARLEGFWDRDAAIRALRGEGGDR